MLCIRIAIALVVSLGPLGCQLDSEEIHREAAAVTHSNGKSLNGKSLNGKSLNGSALGNTLAYTRHGGARLDGKLFDETWLEGSELVGRKGSSVVRGTAMAQAELQAVSDTGQPVKLRLRAVHAPASGDIWRYDVEYQDTDTAWYPICVDAQGSYPAIPLSGWWDQREGVPGGGDKIGDPTRFTFACTHTGTIGKCVQIGYRPWASASGTPLDDHHQACTRLLRNDYCGDGTPHTTEGNVVNLYDDVGVQADTESWVIEAEWEAGGASCFTPHNRGLIQLPCYEERVSVGCGSRHNFALGTLLMSERPLEDTDGL